jgi:DNA (cytosine-5)-methyltransferase 1
LVGEQRGFDGKFGPLYTYGIKVINLFKPKFFVAENVGGIRSANKGLAFKKILGDLENAGDGYNLSVNLYKCEEYGVPQTRHRVVMVGIDKNFNLQYRVPAPFTKHKPITAREALENPPIPKDSPNQELTSQSENVVERLKHIQPGQNAWTADLPERLKLNVKGAKMSQIYRRLHPDFPAYTITGSGGGGTHVYHWGKPRALTNRERARLQTFPDNFVFEGSKESVRRQIGMSVPPRMSQIIFTAILKTFAGIPYQHVEENFNADLFSLENISNKELCHL